MARARNIKPGFFSNDELASCSHSARLLFAGLWTMADRKGRLEDRPIKIKGELFRYENCDVEPWLKELCDRKFIARYEVANCKYIQVNNFGKHQNPHVREPESTIPAPDAPGVCPVQAPESGNPQSGIRNPESGKGNQESGIKEGESEGKPRTKFSPPSADEVATYCAERKNAVDASRFVDFYSSKNWMVGKNKMSDWRASVRSWERDARAGPKTADPRGTIGVVSEYIARAEAEDGQQN